MKEKLINALGIFGSVLYFIIKTFVATLPFIMINCNFVVIFLLILVNEIFPLFSAVLWIWGLVCAIKGVQDIWAIIYYVAFAVIWLPFFIDLISTFSTQKTYMFGRKKFLVKLNAEALALGMSLDEYARVGLPYYYTKAIRSFEKESEYKKFLYYHYREKKLAKKQYLLLKNGYGISTVATSLRKNAAPFSREDCIIKSLESVLSMDIYYSAYTSMIEKPVLQSFSYVNPIIAAYLYVIFDLCSMKSHKRELTCDLLFIIDNQLSFSQDELECYDKCVTIFSGIVNGEINPKGDWNFQNSENNDPIVYKLFECLGDLVKDPEHINDYENTRITISNIKTMVEFAENFERQIWLSTSGFMKELSIHLG